MLSLEKNHFLHADIKKNEWSLHCFCWKWSHQKISFCDEDLKTKYVGVLILCRKIGHMYKDFTGMLCSVLDHASSH